MGPPSIIVANERVKIVAGVLMNSGAALAAAIVVRFYTQPAFDFAFLLWSVSAAALIWCGWLTLSLLEEGEPR